MPRVESRINQKLYLHAINRAKIDHGGNVSDYVRWLIYKDMENPRSATESWKQEIDAQIAAMQRSLDELQKVRKELEEREATLNARTAG